MLFRKNNIIAAVLFVPGLLLQSCATGRMLQAIDVAPSEITGTYTMLQYGCHYGDQLQNVVILLDEKNSQPFEIYDLDTSYRIKHGIPAAQALTEAEAFLRCSIHPVQQIRVRNIPDGSGGYLGYELRPLYSPLEYGMPDVLRINYRLVNGKVRASIRLDEDVRRTQESSGEGGRSDKR